MTKQGQFLITLILIEFIFYLN